MARVGRQALGPGQHQQVLQQPGHRRLGVGHAERGQRRRKRHVEAADPAAGQQGGAHAARQQGQGARLLQQALEHRQRERGHREPGRLRQRAEHRGLEHLAQLDAGGRQHPARTGQRGHGQPGPARQRMAGPGHHHRLVVQQRLEDEAHRQALRCAAEHRVQAARDQHGQQARAAVLDQFQVHPGMVRVEGAQQRRHQGAGGRRDGAQAQGGRGTLAQRGQRFGCLEQPRHGPARGRHQGPPGRRGAHAACMALEQRHAHQALELGQRRGRGRLAHRDLRGRARDAAAVLQRHQQLQLAQAALRGQARVQDLGQARGLGLRGRKRIRRKGTSH